MASSIVNSPVVNAKIQSASRAHLSLLDGFIRMTEESIGAQSDAFVRDSLSDLLGQLRDERNGYASLATSVGALETAA